MQASKQMSLHKYVHISAVFQTHLEHAVNGRVLYCRVAYILTHHSQLASALRPIPSALVSSCGVVHGNP